MSSPAEPPLTAECGDCKRSATLPEGDSAEMLRRLRDFLEEHRSCSFEVSLRLVPEQRRGGSETIDLRTTRSAAASG